MSTSSLVHKETAARISSIDVLQGLTMVIWALDHTCEYLHVNAIFYNLVDLATTTPMLFLLDGLPIFVRQHLCFCPYLSGQKKITKQLSLFLFTHGIWLVFLECMVLNFALWFDLTFSTLLLQVLWAIGLSMMVLSVLIFLPKQLILLIGFVIVATHNILDSISFPEHLFVL